jgi:L-iditol 2-dehydrogenase
MKAVMKTKPGPGLEIKEIPKPSLPKNFPEGEVIVKVGACGICGTDLGIYDWTPWIAQSMQIPRVIGHEISGTIVEVGKESGNWKVGDRIVSDTYLGCGKCYFCQTGKFNLCDNRQGLGSNIDGGMAEYVAIHVMNLFHVPSNVSLEVGAALEPFGVSMHAFEQSGFKAGDKVLILGPGPIGLGLLMIARASGCSKVFITGIGLDQLRLKKAKELGADAIINIEAEDPVNHVMDDTQGRGVDLVFICAGGKGVLMQAMKMVRKGGTVIVLGLFHGEADFDPTLMVEKELTFKSSWRRTPETWYRILDLVGNGTVNLREIVSHTIPLQEIERGFQLIRKGEGLKVVVTP